MEPTLAPAGRTESLMWLLSGCQAVGFPAGSDGKASACNTGDPGSIPGLGRCPGEGNGNPPQYSCLENPYGQRSLVGYSPWDPKEWDTTERLHFLSCQDVAVGSFPYPLLILQRGKVTGFVPLTCKQKLTESESILKKMPKV